MMADFMVSTQARLTVVEISVRLISFCVHPSEGYLHYTKYGNEKYSGVYGAHVVQGETYELTDLVNKGETVHFELHDLYPEVGSTEVSINLRICLDGSCQR